MTQIRKNIVDYNNLYQVSNMKYTVYIIRHISTGQVLYVGKTDNFKRRAYEHLKLHSRTKDWLSVIGTANVIIEEVAKFDNEVDALKYEDALILKYDTINNGYNKYRSGLIKAENPKEYKREYIKTEKYKEYQKNYQKNYQKKYQQTEKYKEKRRERRKTGEYREYERAYKRDYRQAKKFGISIAEYRKLKNDQVDIFKQNKKQPIQLTINF